jgi:hypothetical protein
MELFPVDFSQCFLDLFGKRKGRLLVRELFNFLFQNSLIDLTGCQQCKGNAVHFQLELPPVHDTAVFFERNTYKLRGYFDISPIARLHTYPDFL